MSVTDSAGGVLPIAELEKQAIRAALRQTEGNRTQAAALLGISIRTIETHRFNIMKKLGVNNAVDMVNKTLKENLV